MSVIPENRSTSGDVVDLLEEQHGEARRLFPHLQGGDTSQAEQMPSDLESAIGNTVGPFLAAVDKVRDALRIGKAS